MKNLKEVYSTSLGAVLMLFAVLGYYFGWPADHDVWKRAMEFSVGFVLLFTDPKAIALQIFEKLKSKL